jgi:hypothetical protein
MRNLLEGWITSASSLSLKYDTGFHAFANRTGILSADRRISGAAIQAAVLSGLTSPSTSGIVSF